MLLIMCLLKYAVYLRCCRWQPSFNVAPVPQFGAKAAGSERRRKKETLLLGVTTYHKGGGRRDRLRGFARMEEEEEEESGLAKIRLLLLLQSRFELSREEKESLVSL